MSGANISRAIDTRPLLGEIARIWQQIHPYYLTWPEIFALLHVLCGITERLDATHQREREVDDRR